MSAFISCLVSENLQNLTLVMSNHQYHYDVTMIEWAAVEVELSKIGHDYDGDFSGKQ